VPPVTAIAAVRAPPVVIKTIGWLAGLAPPVTKLNVNVPGLALRVPAASPTSSVTGKFWETVAAPGALITMVPL
jgi:hypothetical protein